jgi:hypothetical protein
MPFFDNVHNSQAIILRFIVSGAATVFARSVNDATVLDKLKEENAVRGSSQ